MISELPAVFATGHIHVAAQSVYRGVYLVNTGTWQEQTKFQASLGLEPTVGTAAIFNLRSMRLSIKKFG
jgi:DNA polymerase II small subunit